MIKEVLHPKIHYYKNVIEDPYVFIKELEESDLMDSYLPQIDSWQEWSSSDKKRIYGKQKECRLNLFRNQTIADRINLKLCSMIAHKAISVGESYCKDTGLNLGYLPQSFYIKKYDVGIGMGPHTDTVIDGESPIVSMVIYLNDDYSGGELCFNDLDIKIKPEAGSVVVFESANVSHDPEAITSGAKYMIPIFFYPR